MQNPVGIPNVARNIFVKGGRFPSGPENYASAMNGAFAFPAPILDLPLRTTIVPRNSGGVPTFTRPTTATFDDWEGIVRTALSGEARFQGARRVRNHLNLSEALPTPNGGGVASIATVTAGFTAPDGTPSAFRATTNLNGGVAGADTSYVDFDVGGPKDFSVPVHSVWLKNNGGGNSVLLRQSSAVLGYVVLIDNTWRRYTVTSAAVLGIVGGMFTLGQRGNINPGVALDFLFWHPQLEDVAGQSNVAPAEYVSRGVLATPYHGANVDGVKYFDVTNPNTVAGQVVTTSTAAPVAIANCMYWDEGQRTNLCLQSEDLTNASWAATRASAVGNTAVAPDGNTTADSIIEDATAGASHLLSVNQAAITSGATQTVSCWFKANTRSWVLLECADATLTNLFGKYFNVGAGVGAVGTTVLAGAGTFTSASITSYPNNWYRCIVTGVVNGGVVLAGVRIFLANADNGASYNGDGVSGLFGWGAMHEEAIFASKYIPTVAAAATRSPDILTYPSAGIIGAASGTFYLETTPEGLSNNATYLSIDDTTNQNFFWEAMFTGFTNQFFTRVATVNQATLSQGVPVPGVAAKLAGSWALNNFSGVQDGGTVATDSSGTLPPVTIIGIGVQNSTLQAFAGIRNVKIWDRQLPDAFIKTITSPTFSGFA